MNETFTGIDLSTDNPPGICPACAVHGVKHAPSGTTYCYCTHSSTGVVRRPDEAWIVFNDTSSERFKQDILSTVACAEIAEDIVGSDATIQ